MRGRKAGHYESINEVMTAKKLKGSLRTFTIVRHYDTIVFAKTVGWCKDEKKGQHKYKT